MVESNGKVKFTVIPSSFASPTLKGRRRKGNLLECATFVALRVIGLRLCDEGKFIVMCHVRGITCPTLKGRRREEICFNVPRSWHYVSDPKGAARR